MCNKHRFNKIIEGKDDTGGKIMGEKYELKFKFDEKEQVIRFFEGIQDLMHKNGGAMTPNKKALKVINEITEPY